MQQTSGLNESITGHVADQRIRREYPDWLNNFSRKVVTSLLQQMSRGCLTVTYPNGEIATFGHQSSGVQAHLRITSADFFTRCVLYADLGLAESYLDALCTTDSVRNLISWFLLNSTASPVLNESKNASRKINLMGFVNRLTHLARANSVAMSRQNISEHYDLGNSFFSKFLDRTMTYSSALFSDDAKTLEDAQMNKLARIVRAAKIQPGDRVLEIGCGWGGLCTYIAKKIDCHITAVTISQEQFNYTTELVAREKLQSRIDVQLIDYRKLQGQFDKIVSIEMIEAVGDEFMDEFIAKINSLLKPEGLLLMQMITCPDARYDTLRRNVDFIQKHIFPGSLLPSLSRVQAAMQKCGELFLIDLFDMTPSYVQTLALWEARFIQHADELRTSGMDERFLRKWIYYFEYCQAAFDMRNISVVQAVYSRPNNLLLQTGLRH